MGNEPQHDRAGEMNLQTAVTKPLRWPRRHPIASAVLLAVLACMLVLAGRGLKPPHFVLDPATQASVTPVDEYVWRKASDWLDGRKYAVLTFDDGPYGHGVDEHILSVLRHHHAHAIFFLVCHRIDDTTGRLLGTFEQEGHIIGNHSFDHLQLNKLEDFDLYQQIEGCSRRIASLTGHRPYYFRPPFGLTSSHVRQLAEASGMQQILWNANTQDSWQTKPEQILYWTREQTQNYSILLMHDKPATAAVLDQALTDLESRGFQFVLPEPLPPDAAAD
ncbi:polysaccharide deacetylase family protein [Dyella sp. M7H15-1]|uniref:polysaccharide deacetylase family protein n=1 Tax=Dyella sp. M7H15-1 TaxID=2501295 RepID=UPI0013E8DA36|nr:polysaccharide deacetylase family protein [Dyella sp. M7H15-1]